MAKRDDFHISPFQEDGKTYGTPTWIWSVVVDGAPYVRGYNGQPVALVSGRSTARAGHVRAAGITKEVVFESVDGPINYRVDDAYGAKYDSPYVTPMNGTRERSATVRVMPEVR